MVEKEQFIKDHFPEVDPGRTPCGNKVLVQFMWVRSTHNGIILSQETKDINQNATVIGRIVKVGPIAYRHRETGDAWKEGAWAEVGDIVLVARFGGFNRVNIPIPGEKDEAVMFATYNDFDVVDKLEGQFEHYNKLL